MTLEQLRIFAEVAQRAHITNAAKALNMTQSAVSAAVNALETRHGVILFDRVGRSIVLNQAGRVFLQEAQLVLSQAKAAEAALNDLAGLMRGELSVMASLTVGGYWLPKRLAHYHAAYPGVTLKVRMGNTEAVADAVDAGLVELGLVEGPVDRPMLSSHIIATDEMIVVVSPGHPWAKLDSLSVAQLAASPWIVREPGSGTRHTFEDMLARHGAAFSSLGIAIVLPGNEAVLGAVEAGLGATFVSRSAASSQLRGGLLVEVAFPAIPRPFYLLRHKSRYCSKAAAAFENLISLD
jgi:DNA-binding transcriptional LysR family regulator